MKTSIAEVSQFKEKLQDVVGRRINERDPTLLEWSEPSITKNLTQSPRNGSFGNIWLPTT